MKKTKFLTMLALCVMVITTLTSCEKNDDLIVGNWEITQAIIDGKNYTQTVSDDIWTFRSDYTCSANYLLIDNLSGSYTISNDALHMMSDYIYNNPNDLLFWWRCTLDLDIIEITKDKMSVSGTLKYYDIDSDNSSFSVSIKFRKI